VVDAIVIGAGPNGLVAGIELARHGWDVLIVESRERPGGALYSEELTVPGFLHDVGAAFFPFAAASPAFRELGVADKIEWRHCPLDSAHPAQDGTCASIGRQTELARASLGQPDGDAWQQLASWAQSMGDRLPAALLSPLPGIRTALRLGPGNLIRFGRYGIQSSAGWSRRHFQSASARRVVPALALHADLGPLDRASAGLGLTLALLAATAGFPVPRGGARAMALALVDRFQELGGKLRLGCRAERIVVHRRRAVAVQSKALGDIAARRAVIADVGAPALYLQLLSDVDVPGWALWRMRRFTYGWGTFKMDWALEGAVPWQHAEPRESAVVHTGESVDDLIAFTRQVRDGRLPDNPYLVIGQQSLADPTRAPQGNHTLWAYSHVPSNLAGGWQQNREAFADRVEERIERLAPGFRQLIRGRAIHDPTDLEAMDENLVGGDLGGGSARLSQQLFFRPMFPYFRYRTPVTGIYLASASAHPGPGVHGACGLNAARAALADNRAW
jgi:phytoene dehydrogenase-like protein